MHPHWPLFDLRCWSPGLELRPVRESDLPMLAELLPDDVEQDPSAPVIAGLGEKERRVAVLHQGYWRAMASWSPRSWALTFLATEDGRVVGTQTLEGEDFVDKRTVDSASWLVPAARGRGLGRAMRTAVLALAFGPLGARVAVTSAWTDNAASLRVSERLGYTHVQYTPHEAAGRSGALEHLRLTREAWSASALGDHVRVEGFGACRPYFGLDAAGSSGAEGGFGKQQRSR